MSMRYKILFSVAVLHDYYTSNFCEDFEIIPSPATALLFKDLGLLWRSLGHKLIVLAKTDIDDKPFITISNAAKFSFYLKLNNPHFNNFTNLSNQPGYTKKYYFSNSNQTKIGTTHYLNAKIAAYSNTTDYKLGSLAANAANDVFETIKINGPTAGIHALSDQTFWMNRGKFQYANHDDLLDFTSIVYPFAAIAASNFNISIFGHNPVTGNDDLAVTDPYNLTFTSNQTIVQIRLEQLPAAKYKIEVNGESKFVYLDTEAAYANILGIIEVFNHLPAANSFALLTATGKLKSPAFTLRFANRAVIWKYTARTADVTGVEDTVAAFTFLAEAGNLFISGKPIPMVEKPLTTILLKSTALGDISPLANPGKDRLGTIIRDGDTYLCSELHLNY